MIRKTLGSVLGFAITLVLLAFASKAIENFAYLYCGPH